MKIIIAGGRYFIPQKQHHIWLITKLKEIGCTEVICGMAKGADTFGMMVALQNGFEVLRFYANWDKYGKSAGYKRNIEMAKVADACILFPGGRGTGHVKNIAIKHRLQLIEYKDGI